MSPEKKARKFNSDSGFSSCRNYIEEEKIFCANCGKDITDAKYVELEGEIPRDYWLNSSTFRSISTKKTTFLCLNCWKKLNQISSANY